VRSENKINILLLNPQSVAIAKWGKSNVITSKKTTMKTISKRSFFISIVFCPTLLCCSDGESADSGSSNNLPARDMSGSNALSCQNPIPLDIGDATLLNLQSDLPNGSFRLKEMQMHSTSNAGDLSVSAKDSDRFSVDVECNSFGPRHYPSGKRTYNASFQGDEMMVISQGKNTSTSSLRKVAVRLENGKVVLAETSTVTKPPTENVGPLTTDKISHSNIATKDGYYSSRVYSLSPNQLDMRLKSEDAIGTTFYRFLYERI
jgi:hypothetical protein